MSVTVWIAPPSTCTLPSVPVSAEPSVDRLSAPSALPPVTWSVAALPSSVVASWSCAGVRVDRCRDRRARARGRGLHRRRELRGVVGAVRERQRDRVAVDAELQRVVGAVDRGRCAERGVSRLDRAGRRLRDRDRVAARSRARHVGRERREAERLAAGREQDRGVRRRPERQCSRRRWRSERCPAVASPSTVKREVPGRGALAGRDRHRVRVRRRRR